MNIIENLWRSQTCRTYKETEEYLCARGVLPGKNGEIPKARIPGFKKCLQLFWNCKKHVINMNLLFKIWRNVSCLTLYHLEVRFASVLQYNHCKMPFDKGCPNFYIWLSVSFKGWQVKHKMEDCTSIKSVCVFSHCCFWYNLLADLFCDLYCESPVTLHSPICGQELPCRCFTYSKCCSLWFHANS